MRAHVSAKTLRREIKRHFAEQPNLACCIFRAPSSTSNLELGRHAAINICSLHPYTQDLEREDTGERAEKQTYFCPTTIVPVTRI